jgi:hypothetical protein
MNFATAVQVLSDAKIDFVLIGGLAAILHGSSRVTFDLDICFSRSSANLKRLADALAPFHPRPRGFPKELPFVWDAGTLRNGTVFTLETDLGPIDLLAEVAGVGGYEEVLASSVQVEAFDRTIRLLDLRGLIRSKRAAGRPKDLADVAALESLLEAEEP